MTKTYIFLRYKSNTDIKSPFVGQKINSKMKKTISQNEFTETLRILKT